MFNRDWLSGAAVGIVATYLFALVPPLIEHRPTPPDELASRQYNDDARKAMEWGAAVKQKGKPEVTCGQGDNTPNCSEQYSTALDLSAQWATAQATRSVETYTGVQTLIGLLGLLGLGWTIRLTRKTAKAAIDAAKTAEEQAEVVRKEFLATHRPKIRLRFTDNISIISGVPLTAKLFFSNIGDSDGTIISMSIDFFHRETNTLRHSGFQVKYEASAVFPIVVPPGKDAHVSVTGRLFSADELQKIVNGETEICMIGAVLYSDGTGVERATGFFRTYNPKANLFLRVGQDDPWHERDYED